MSSVASELDRLARAQARARALPWGRGVQLGLVAVAVLLAGLHRLLVPLPLLEGLAGRPWAVLGVALALLLSRPWLVLLGRAVLRPPAHVLARRLDERPGGHDEVATALDAEQGRVRGALAGVLVQGVAARLAAEVPAHASTPRRAGLLAPLGLAVFIALLLLPGVGGLRGEGPAHRRSAGEDTGREAGPPRPLDADAWLRRHLRVVLEPARSGVPGAATWLRVRLELSEALPAGVPLLGTLELLWDEQDAAGAARAALGEVAVAAGSALAPSALDVDLRALEALSGRLTPGVHRAQARLVPSAPPFTQPQRSAVLEVEIPPPGSQGALAPTPPAPAPEPLEAVEPPPAPASPQAPSPQPAGGREEAIVPFVNPGDTVRKERAVVAARAPDAALERPPAQPLEEAVRDPVRVAEQAVVRERIAPADRDLVRRYFAVLRRLVEPVPR
ncbi:MAG: hypothetical protein ACKOCB_10890 [Planctomycetia bacterium]